MLIWAALLVWWGRRKALRAPWHAWVPLSAPIVVSTGLAFTAAGLRWAFDRVGQAPVAERAKQLSDDIATAMTATAVAVPIALIILIACTVWFARAPRRS